MLAVGCLRHCVEIIHEAADTCETLRIFVGRNDRFASVGSSISRTRSSRSSSFGCSHSMTTSPLSHRSKNRVSGRTICNLHASETDFCKIHKDVSDFKTTMRTKKYSAAFSRPLRTIGLPQISMEVRARPYR